MQILNQTKYNEHIIEFAKILLFGCLSLIFNKIKFVVPGAEGMVSDLRGLPLIISVFYLKRWYSFVFICVFTGFGLFEGGSPVATYFMHLIGLLYLFFAYKFISKRVANPHLIILFWILAMLVYFYGSMYPLMVIFGWILGIVQVGDMLERYLKVAFEIRFEMMLTTSISMLYLMYLSVNHRLQHRNKELELSVIKAEESDRLKTAFLQNLSHEIRTPMNGIQGFSRLLMENCDEVDQVRSFCKHVLLCSDQLLNIVNDIIDISQIETQQISISKSTHSIDEMFENVKHHIFANEDQKISRLSLDLNDSANKQLTTDFYKLERILYHLINNALKFSGDKPVVVSCNISNGELNILVTDSGQGIASKYKDRIYKKFYQVESDLTRRHGGNGLGLAIVQGFTQALNGNIDFESELGKGTNFKIGIPIDYKTSGTQ